MAMMWEGLQVPELEGFTGFVPPDGTGSSRVMIMGEAPGEMEVKYGRPFYEQAPAGSCFARLLRRAGLERDSFVITNSVWSRPPGNYLDGSKVEGAAIAAFHPLRERAFEIYRPRVIVALGGIALRTLTNYGHKGASITAVQGYILDGPWDGTWVIPALHPSAIMRGEQRMSGVVIWALQRAMDIAKNGFVRASTRYITNPGLDDMLTFERGYNPDRHFLSGDIETPDSVSLDDEELEDQEDDISYNINRASLCYSADDGYAISFPWQEPYITVARRMLASYGPKRTWNGTNFDGPRLKAAGAPICGRHYDSMWAWKFLQPTLPRSLGFVAPFYGWSGEPWKHTSYEEPERYSCQDAHALQLIADGVDAHLKQKNQWEVYERHVVQLGEVLTQMSVNGLPYSAERAAEFERELQAKWDDRFAQLQQRVPNELKPSKQKSGLKKLPKDLTGLTLRKFKVVEDGTVNIIEVERWCKLEPFLPTSTQQVQALLKHHGLPVGKNRKTKRDSADDEHLKKMCKRISSVKKHADLLATLQMIRECRQLNKVLGTYVKGWKPGRDGRIHATPGHWGKMFRVSWRRPNISATIQDKQEEYVAQGFRKCVAVAAGNVLLECVSPESKILRSDLTWVNAADVQVGNELIGFSCVNGRDSHYQATTVEGVQLLERPRVRVRTTAGDCIVAENHMFVARFKSYKRRWVAAKDLMGRLGTGALLTFLGNPWEVDRSWESGYLAGFADGEGSVKATQWQVAQNLGPTLDYVLDLLKARSFHPCRRIAKVTKKSYGYRYGKPYTTQQCQFTSMYETMRFLGTMRPLRLAQKARQVWEGRQTWGKRSKPVRVLSVEPLGVGPVIAIKTTTGNYISDGYFSHNCDWKGIEAVLVGWFADDSEYQRLARLGVHDYMGIHMAGGSVDLSLPDAELKRLFKDFKRAEPKLRDDAKHTVHGTNYGMGPRLMADLYEMSEKEAKRLQGLYFDLFPKIKQWQGSVLDRASRECKLRNPFGYCVASDTPVLTAGLLWKPVSELSVGDRLLAFDESPMKGRRARQYRLSDVLYNQPTDTETVMVELSNGEHIVTTPEHRWLVYTYSNSKHGWVQSQRLKIGQRVVKALRPWDVLEGKDAGWLAGIFDGEAHLSYTGIDESAGMLSISQNPGLVLDNIKRLLTKFDFTYGEHRQSGSNCRMISVNGGLVNRLRLLGSIRPIRLLAKALQSSFGEVQNVDDVRVVKVTSCGMRTVSVLTTSTQTFIANGYAMHNCMPFWEVYRWDSKRQVHTYGEDAKSAIAFLPRDTAAAMLKEVLLRLKPLADEGIMLCSTHDSITCEVEEGELMGIASLVKAEMEREVPELGGLSIGVECKAGSAWHESEMEVLDLAMAVSL